MGNILATGANDSSIKLQTFKIDASDLDCEATGMYQLISIEQ